MELQASQHHEEEEEEEGEEGEEEEIRRTPLPINPSSSTQIKVAIDSHKATPSFLAQERLHLGSSLNRTAPCSPMPSYSHQKPARVSLSPPLNHGGDKLSINQRCISGRHEGKTMDGGIRADGHKPTMNSGINAHAYKTTNHHGVSTHGMSTVHEGYGMSTYHGNGMSTHHGHGMSTHHGHGMSTRHRQGMNRHNGDGMHTHHGDGISRHHGYGVSSDGHKSSISSNAHGHKSTMNHGHISTNGKKTTVSGHGHTKTMHHNGMNAHGSKIKNHDMDAHGSKIMNHDMDAHGSRSMHHGMNALGSKRMNHGISSTHSMSHDISMRACKAMNLYGSNAHGNHKAMNACISKTSRHGDSKTMMSHGIIKTHDNVSPRSSICNRGYLGNDDRLSAGSGGTNRHSFENEPQRQNPNLNHILNHINNHRKSHSNEGSTTTTTTTTTTVGSVKGDLGLGPLFLRLASAMYFSGENPHKALECASRAWRFLERASSSEEEETGKPSLQLVMSLYVLASIHCKLGQWEEALHVLGKALYGGPNVLDYMDNMDHALAAFSGHMQLGDVFAMLGQQGNALECYHRAYHIQKSALGDMDLQLAETCGYLAEAHFQALQFDDAAHFCEEALAIHAEHRPPGSVEEATDRRLMALILAGNGEYELALEHLVLANASLTKHSKDEDVAAIDSNIGDMYAALGRYDEAVFSYRKSINMYKSIIGDNHMKVAYVYTSLAELFVTIGKHRDAKIHCESAVRIYGHPNAGYLPGELASGLADIARVYINMNEREKALMFLQRAFEVLDGIPGHQADVVGIEGQLGVLYYSLERFEESFMAFKDAILKLREAGQDRSPLLGMLLNQMALTCIGLDEIEQAAKALEEAKTIFEGVSGPHHNDTLAVSSNLAGVYDALGRSDEAIHLLESILDVKEEKLGTVHPEVDSERRRLMQHLKEVGRDRVRKTNTLEALLLLTKKNMHRKP